MSDLVAPLAEDLLQDLRRQVAALGAPPPWKWGYWRGSFVLHAGRPTHDLIMGFVRHGLHTIRPQWRDHATGEIIGQGEWDRREGAYHYLHPDARYLEAAANAVPGLLAEIDRLRRVVDLVTIPVGTHGDTTGFASCATCDHYLAFVRDGAQPPHYCHYCREARGAHDAA